MKIISILFSALLIVATMANAEQKMTKGNWDIHYIAFPSSFLEPEVAKQYQLQRSKYQAVINLSVLDNGQNNKAQRVAISGQARNLLGQTKTLEFKQVVDGDAIYYLAQLEYRNEEQYKIAITVSQGSRTEQFEFSKKFYVD